MCSESYNHLRDGASTLVINNICTHYFIFITDGRSIELLCDGEVEMTS